MTMTSMVTPALRHAVDDEAATLRAEGWDVVVEPAGDELPERLRPFPVDVLAVRDGQHRVVQVTSARRPLTGLLALLAQRIEQLDGWQLDLVHVRESPPSESQAQLADRSRRARDLADIDPEAALLLGWSAAEGALHRLAEHHDLDVEPAGPLLAELDSRGLVEEEVADVLRAAWRRRSALAHGWQSSAPDPALVRRLADVTQTLLSQPAAS